MKSRIIAILLSVTLLAPLGMAAAPVAVQAEETVEEQEAKQDPAEEESGAGETAAPEAAEEPQDVKDTKEESEETEASTRSTEDTSVEKDTTEDSTAEEKSATDDVATKGEPESEDVATKGEPESEDTRDTKETDESGETDEVDQETLDEWYRLKTTPTYVEDDDALPITFEVDEEDEDIYEVDDAVLYSNDVAYSSAGYNLTGLELTIYSGLKYDIERIAKGESNSTNIYAYLSDEENQQIDDMSIDEFRAMSVKLWWALTYDLGPEMYWYGRARNYYWDKATKTYHTRLAVDKDYSTSGKLDTETDTVDPDKIKTATNILRTADRYVEEAKDMTFDEAMIFFKGRICALVEYHTVAAKEGPFGEHDYGQAPWNIIYVFDLDPDTNVVCEGYAKAFKYLVDHWKELTGSDVNCYLTGGILGTYGTDPDPDRGHMWNTLEYNGSRYLVDVTNCDTNSSGYPDKLFMKGPQYYSTMIEEDSPYYGRTTSIIYEEQNAEGEDIFNLRFWYLEVDRETQKRSYPMLDIFNAAQIDYPLVTR